MLFRFWRVAFAVDCILRLRILQLHSDGFLGFFDFEHGQTGVAPNAIELHPVLRFHCLSD